MADVNAYLLNPSLYDRSIAEFVYTVKAFETVLDPAKLSKFFHDTNKIDVNEFFDGDSIKPAGSANDADNTNTIYGVIESWAQGGENDAGGGEGTIDRRRKNVDIEDMKMSKEVLDAAKDRGLKTLDDVQDSDRKRGNVIYIQSPVSGDFSPEEFVNAYNPGYYIYTGSEWKRLKHQ